MGVRPAYCSILLRDGRVLTIKIYLKICGRPSKFADQNLRWPGAKPVVTGLANPPVEAAVETVSAAEVRRSSRAWRSTARITCCRSPRSLRQRGGSGCAWTRRRGSTRKLEGAVGKLAGKTERKPGRVREETLVKNKIFLASSPPPRLGTEPHQYQTSGTAPRPHLP